MLIAEDLWIDKIGHLLILTSGWKIISEVLPVAALGAPLLGDPVEPWDILNQDLL